MVLEFKNEYSWLSNFSTCNDGIYFQHRRFSSVECAYQAAKAPDNGTWQLYCQSNSPGIVKRESRKIELHSSWNDNYKLSLMEELLRQKFKIEGFKLLLLETNFQNLQEGNYWGDRFWGVDLKVNPNVGENHLGRLIMKIRSELQNT